MPVPTEITPPGVKLRDFEDFDTARQDIFEGAKTSMTKAFPMSYGGLRLELADVDYADPDHFDLARQKEALLKDERLGRRLRGSVILRDETTGAEIERKQMTLMKVPYLTERGTFIRDGNEFVHINQLRLLPGVYTRRKLNGELETQFNVRAGTGNNFRVSLQPETSQYRLQVKASDLHLYSLLKDLGVEDDDLEKRWGKEILDINRERYDTRVLDKAFEHLVPKWKKPEGDLTREDKQRLVKEALDAAQVHARIAKRNLPNLFGNPFREKRASLPQEYRLPEPVSSQVKWAGVQSENLRLIGAYLNTELQAGIDTQAASDELAEAIVKFACTDPRVTEDTLLQAAREIPEPAAPLVAMPYTIKAAAAPSAPVGSAGCLTLRLPLDLSSEILRWSMDNIPSEHRADDGLERDVHATVCFGFTPDVTADEVREALSDWGGQEIKLRTEKVSRFKAKDYDVIKLGVESADLRELNRFLRRYFGKRIKSSFPSFLPHVTLCYVKHDALLELDGNARLAGRVVSSASVIFSKAKRADQTLIHLENLP